MGWYRIEADKYPADKIQDLFEGVFLIARAPKGAALLVQTVPGNPNARYYLTPEAARLCAPLIKAFDGEPCERPSLDGTTVLAGQTHALELLA